MSRQTNKANQLVAQTTSTPGDHGRSTKEKQTPTRILAKLSRAEGQHDRSYDSDRDDEHDAEQTDGQGPMGQRDAATESDGAHHARRGPHPGKLGHRPRPSPPGSAATTSTVACAKRVLE